MNTIYIYDEIGPSEWGLIDDKSIISELSKIEDADDLTVRINSPGGSVFAGMSIYNALNRREGHTIVEVDALAASAASFIAMAADEIRIAENAMMMIHNAWTLAMGDAAELREVADVMEQLDGNISATYSTRSRQDQSVITQLMADETWFTAEKAVAAGLADSVSQPLNVSVSWSDGMNFRHPPAAIVARSKTHPRKVREAATEGYRSGRAAHVNRLIAEVKAARRKLSLT